ncbi:MAG: primosomal protein N' [bacterium]
MYAQIVFPLPFRNAFTYEIPPELESLAVVGVRAVVPFGKRTLTGFVIGLSETTDIKEKIKPIKDILDENPVFTAEALKFYEWIGDYYLSTLGEALKNSVPYGLEVESQRFVITNHEVCSELLQKEKNKNSNKSKIVAVLVEKEYYKISQLQKILKKKNIHSTLNSLEKSGAVSIVTQLEEAKVRVKTQKYVKLAVTLDEVYESIPEIESRAPKQVVILLELISRGKEDISQSDLVNKTKTHQAAITSLVNKGLIEVFDKEVERVFLDTYSEEHQKLTLTEAQQNIVDEIGKEIDTQNFGVHLLHGVTGSGKTQVYIELAEKTLAMNKTVLILVPEISLTPQISSRFYNNFGNTVAVIHSRLSMGERYDTWRGIIAGKYKLVIGPRSALFAPLNNIGLIVVDEEHDGSYKQYDMIPKYNARDSAIIRAKLAGCPVLLGSATPSVDSMYNAQIGKFKLWELTERVDNAKMPHIRLVDLTIEKKKNRVEGIFSRDLIDAVNNRLRKKEAVIILQNRRGFSTQIFCADCGEIELCDDCSVSLVHHLDRNLLQCHYCGFSKPVSKVCGHCGSINLKFTGTGTQKVEDEIQYYFPNAKIERIDSDTITKKGRLGEILNQFRKGEIDILVGTQMVSKGMDFSNVTLVGVISAETTLWLPDFRADERTFQLLTQVAGRAGRSKVEGEVIIQTANHRHFVLQKVLINDYKGFYENELKLRQQSSYPPFSRLCLIETKDKNEADARLALNEYFKIILKRSKGLKITSPNPAILSKLMGMYRYQLVIKSSRASDPSGRILRTAVLESYIEFNRMTKFKEVKMIIDIDPQSVI